MKKTAGKIATIFMVILLSNTFTGCLTYAALTGDTTVLEAAVDLVQVIVEAGEAIGDTVRAEAYDKAVQAAKETVKQYDEVDTF